MNRAWLLECKMEGRLRGVSFEIEFRGFIIKIATKNFLLKKEEI